MARTRLTPSRDPGPSAAAPDESRFNLRDYTDLLRLEGDTIAYLQTAGRDGTPKSYRWSDPEERVRAQFYVELVRKYQYPVSCIDLEVEVYRRVPEDFADIVVYRDEAHQRPFLVVETKADGIRSVDFEQAIKQAWGNANNLRAKYAAAVAGSVQFAFEAKNFNIRTREQSGINIPERYGRPVTYRYVKGDPEWDLRPSTLDELRNRFQQCHDILWEGGKRNPAQAFDEMGKLMFCKLQDERHGTADGGRYQFQIGTHEAPKDVTQRVREIYEASRAQMPNVFRTQIEVGDDLVYRVVEVLQGTSLNRTDLDAKGRAFEKFLPTVFRGEMGQYFTPRSIVRFVVAMEEPTTRDSVIDPACGSGGFLLYALERVQRESERRYKAAVSQRDYWKDWALRGLHGIEINDQISRIAMMGMILHEDGHTNILCMDSLLTFEEAREHTANYRAQSFDLVMTNPPFGARVRRVTPKAAHPYLDTYELGKGRASQRTEVLFTERCLDLLRPGGRLCILLPEGVFSNPSRPWAAVREFCEDRGFVRAVVSLPKDTFKSAGADVRASLLFMQKYTEAEKREYDRLRGEVAKTKKLVSTEEARRLLKERFDYPVFLYAARHVGITATGEADEDELLPAEALPSDVQVSCLELYLDFVREYLKTPTRPLQAMKVLNSRAIVAAWRILSRWDLKAAQAAAFRLANPSFIPFGEFIEEATELVRPMNEPDKLWPVYGVNNRDGVFLSHHQLGREFEHPYKRIKRDWFFHNPTRANVGSLGRVPVVPEDAITSPEYQVWRIREDRRKDLIPEYVEMMLRSKFFLTLVDIHRVGAVKERLFVQNLMEIPLPEVGVVKQRQAVRQWQAAKAALSVARNEVSQTIDGLDEALRLRCTEPEILSVRDPAPEDAEARMVAEGSEKYGADEEDDGEKEG